MVGTISPVVYRNSSLGRYGWLAAATAYTLGSVVGGCVVGALLGSLGSFLPLYFYQSRLWLLIGLPAIAYSLHELRLVTLPYPQRRGHGLKGLAQWIG